MNIINALKQLRDDLKTWVTNNLNALNAKIDEKTIPIDSELDSNSTNPVQNKAVTKAINNIPKFSGDYNDLTNAPNITEDDSGNMVIADESGNIIFKADADGIATTALTLNGQAAATENYVDEAVSNIEIPNTDLSNHYTKDETDEAINKAKAELSESIVAESEEWTVVDDAGNIILTANAEGLHTTALTLNGEDVTTLIEEKVAKEEGKGLSTNDFTDEYKETLDNLGDLVVEETDPTVPDWAKAENKPTYTAEEVNALPDTTTLADLADDESHRTVSDTEKATWNSKSDFSGSYNDLTDAPNITEDDSGELIIADDAGNIIFRSGESGFETTQLVTNTLIVGGTDIAEALADKVGSEDIVEAVEEAVKTAIENGDISAEIKTYIESYVEETLLGGSW